MMVDLIYFMQPVESYIINVLLRTSLLISGFGDDPEDIPVSVPDLPLHLSEWTRRASKVDIDVISLSTQLIIGPSLSSTSGHAYTPFLNSSKFPPFVYIRRRS